MHLSSKQGCIKLELFSLLVSEEKGMNTGNKVITKE